jgi:hypothetical protein
MQVLHALVLEEKEEAAAFHLKDGAGRVEGGKGGGGQEAVRYQVSGRSRRATRTSTRRSAWAAMSCR